MANCNTQQLNITCGTDVVLHDRLIFDGETFDPNLSVGIAANLVSSLGKRTSLSVEVSGDELIITIPWMSGRFPGCCGLEVTGTCNSKRWSTYADSLIRYTKATRPGMGEVTVESDFYDITMEVGYRYAEGGNINDVLVNGDSVVRAGKANITVPTKVSELVNDEEYTTKDYVDGLVDDAGKVDDVKVNGVSVLQGKEADITVPTNLSDLNNDAHYQTADDVAQAIEDLQDGITVEGETLII